MRALLRRPHISSRGHVKRRVPQPFPPAPAERAETATAARAETDPAARRVRAAGGPTDIAFYECACGCVFDAAVSTSVRCPHCGAEQAW